MPRSGDGTGRAHDTICTAMTDPADSYTQARTDTGLTRDTTVRRLDSDYQQLIDQLRAKFRQASQALTAATIAAVPDTTVTGFTAGGGTGMMPGWCTKDGGTFPPDLHAETALGGAHLLADRQQLLAGQAVADRFNQYLADSTTHSKTEIEAFLARLHPYSAAFRQGFLATVDLNTLLTVQRLAHGGPGIDEQTARAYGGLVTAVGTMMAAGSNPELQGAYPVPASFYTGWVDLYEHAQPPDFGYYAMAELVQTGQADKATWNSELLTKLTRDTITFEQQQLAANPLFRWSEAHRHGFMATDAERSLSTNPSHADAVAMMLDATSHDDTAALGLFTTADHKADTKLLHHLYAGRQDVMGTADLYGTTLGNTLNAATTTVGAGGPGTPEYISAAIVSDIVNHYGSPDHKLIPGMEPSIVNMLCHHIQDVNAALGEIQWTGDVHPGEQGRLLAREQLTVSVLDKDHVKDLLTEAFGPDYSSADDSRPLFQQFAAVQTAALKADFLTVSAIADPDQRAGWMEGLANQHGVATRLASDSLRDALVAHGVQDDQANAQARATASFMVGLVTDGKVESMNTTIGAAVPGIPGKVAVLVAGKAVDGITTWAIDQVIPPTNHTGEMKAESAKQDAHLASTNSLAHLSWLDEAGQLGPAAPDAWAAAHPDKTGFLRRGTDGHWHFADLAILRDQAKASQHTTNTAWNHFTDYWQDFGDPQLRRTDLYENYKLGLVTG
jgi:hypothetical protein